MTFDMMISKALGVLILARNGDHSEFLLASSSAVDHAISTDAYLAFLTIVFSDSTG